MKSGSSSLSQDAGKTMAWRLFYLLGGSFLILLVIVAFLFFRDDPVPKDEDLRPAFAVDADPENGLAVFLRALGAESDKLKEWETLPAPARDFERGQEAALQAQLEKHATILSSYETLQLSDPAIWRWPLVDKNFSMLTLFKEVGYVPAVSRQQVTAKIVLLARRGDAEAAVKEAVRLVELGHHLLKLDGGSIHLAIGLIVRKLGEASLKHALQDVTDDGLLQRAQVSLAPLDIASRDIVPILKVEYLSFCNTVAHLKARPGAAAATTGAGLAGMNLLLRPHRTMNFYGSLLRPVIAELDRGWTEGLAAEKRRDEELHESTSNRLILFLGGNAAGKLMIKGIGSETSSMISSACASSARHRMTRVNLALRRYELARDRTPETLQELVPDFLPAVPLDPFDNQPLRWDAAKKWLYSVGRNGIDEQGQHGKTESIKEPDLVMPYWWSAKGLEK